MAIPKDVRERLDIREGDEVAVYEADGRIVIEKAITRTELAEGYRATAERARDITADFRGTSRESDESLGEAPDW